MTRFFIISLVLTALIMPSDPGGEVNRIPAINEGGCGWFAYYTARQLPGATVEVLGDYDHVFVRWKGRLIDSRGIWGPLAGLIPTRTITIQELGERLKGPGWNPRFNRGDTIKIIERINQ